MLAVKYCVYPNICMNDRAAVFCDVIKLGMSYKHKTNLTFSYVHMYVCVFIAHVAIGYYLTCIHIGLFCES